MAPTQLRLYLPCKPVLTMASLGDDDYSELSSRYKASHVRLMLYWLQKKTRCIADERPEDETLQVLAECVYGLQRSTEIQSMGGLILTSDEANEASRCLFVFTGAFSWLALKCLDEKLAMFRCRPKLHYLMHTAEDLKSLKLNQLKLFSTFTEESFLGRIKTIATQVHGRTLTLRVMRKTTAVSEGRKRRHISLVTS